MKFVNRTDHFRDKFIIVTGHSELVQVVPLLPAILPEPHIVFRFRVTILILWHSWNGDEKKDDHKHRCKELKTCDHQ